VGQSREHIAQIGVGVNAPPSAALDEGVDDGAALTGIGIPNEEPVLFAKRRWANSVLHAIVVDFYLAVAQIHLQSRPLSQGIVDSFAQQTVWQETAQFLEPC